MDPGSALFERAGTLALGTGDLAAGRILALLEEAATFDHAEALYALGTWRHHGIGGRQDDAAAAAAWARAAELGHDGARFQLAIACERGIGTAPDPERAYALYAACAGAGMLEAVYEAGRCRWYGIGTDVDRAVAQECFDTARRYGLLEAVADDVDGEPPRRMPKPSVWGPFRPARRA